MVASVPAGLSKDGKVLLTYIQAEFDKFSEKINSFTEKFLEMDQLKEKVGELSIDMEKMKLDMEKQILSLKNDLDAADQYERKDMLILSGPAVLEICENENVGEIVRDLIEDYLDINVDLNDINITHRLGPLTRAQADNKKRNIVMKLCRRDLKRQIIMASKKQKQPRLYCNESLSVTRRSIFHSLRKMKKDHPDLVKGCTTMDGKIYAYTPPPNSSRSTNNVRHCIMTMEHLRTFCRDHVKHPLDNFLVNFLGSA